MRNVWIELRYTDIHSRSIYLQPPVQSVQQHIQSSNASVCGLTYCKPFQPIKQTTWPPISFTRWLHIHPIVHLKERGSQHKSIMPQSKSKVTDTSIDIYPWVQMQCPNAVLPSWTANSQQRLLTNRAAYYLYPCMPDTNAAGSIWALSPYLYFNHIMPFLY